MSRLIGPAQEETVQVKTKRANSGQEYNVHVKRKQFIAKKTTSRVSECMELETSDLCMGNSFQLVQCIAE